MPRAGRSFPAGSFVTIIRGGPGIQPIVPGAINGSTTVSVSIVKVAKVVPVATINGSTTVTVSAVSAGQIAQVNWFELQMPSRPVILPFTPSVSGSTTVSVNLVANRKISPVTINGSTTVTVGVQRISTQVATLLPLILGATTPVAAIQPATVNGQTNITVTLLVQRGVAPSIFGSTSVSVNLAATRLFTIQINGSTSVVAGFFKDVPGGQARQRMLVRVGL